PRHVVIGVVLAGPLVVKVPSTTFRFVLYYRGSPAFVETGPPRRVLRVLGPILTLTTLALVGTGIGLLVTGPARPGSLSRPLFIVHAISTLVFVPLIAVHTAAYLRRVPRARPV